ncbi:alpha/beta hydrolase family protein [Kribbella sp. VKM Ac-2568]|nr:alpha/beta hydrolase family protein [Kribbella sp. VKM Ac-2568]
MRLEFRSHGPLGGEPLVLLHGLTSDGSSFDGVVGALAERWRVYVPDQRGHGRNCGPVRPLKPKTPRSFSSTVYGTLSIPGTDSGKG